MLEILKEKIDNFKRREVKIKDPLNPSKKIKVKNLEFQGLANKVRAGALFASYQMGYTPLQHLEYFAKTGYLRSSEHGLIGAKPSDEKVHYYSYSRGRMALFYSNIKALPLMPGLGMIFTEKRFIPHLDKSIYVEYIKSDEIAEALKYIYYYRELMKNLMVFDEEYKNVKTELKTLTPQELDLRLGRLAEKNQELIRKREKSRQEWIQRKQKLAQVESNQALYKSQIQNLEDQINEAEQKLKSLDEEFETQQEKRKKMMRNLGIAAAGVAAVVGLS